MKIWHLIRMGIEPARALHFLRQQKYNKHIILERKNYLRVYVSGVAARLTYQYHCRNYEAPVFSRIHLDLGEVQRELPIFAQFYEEIKRVLSENCLLIIYEDEVLPDPVIAYKKIVSSLGLKPRNVTVRYKRTNVGDLKKIVVNFDELRQCLKGTDYEWMLTGE